MSRALRIAALVLFPCIALAQPDLSPLQRPSRPMIEAAQQHYLTGSRFFETGQYDAALVEFEAAFRLSGESDFLHNISWTHEKAGRIKEAIEYAVRYQSAVQDAEEQERARRRVEFLKQRYASGATEPTTAPSSPISPAPAPQPPSAPPNAPSPAPEPPKPGSQHKVPPLSIGLLASGGALALGGIGCLAGAWSTSQQVGNTDLTFAEGSALSSRGHALNATGIALTVVGGAVVAGGAVMWAVLARLGHE